MAAEPITNGYGRPTRAIFEDPRLSVPISFAVSPDVLKYDGPRADDAYFDQTAFRLWPLSLTLCRWLCAHPEIVRGKRVVELGAGFGALGLVCAALGAARVVLTDMPDALPLLEAVAAANPQLAVAVAPCTWGVDADVRRLVADGRFDVVLAADVVYKQAAAVQESLAATQAALLAENGEAIVGYEFRGSMLEDLPWMEAITAHFPEPVSESLAAFDDGNDGPTDDDVRWVYRYRLEEVAAAAEATEMRRLLSVARATAAQQDAAAGWPVWSCAAWDGGANAAGRFQESAWWEARPGAAEERCHVLDGRATLRPDGGGAPVEIRGGDWVVFRKGFSCEWIVEEPIRKRYAYFTAAGAAWEP